MKECGMMAKFEISYVNQRNRVLGLSKTIWEPVFWLLTYLMENKFIIIIDYLVGLL